MGPTTVPAAGMTVIAVDSIQASTVAFRLRFRLQALSRLQAVSSIHLRSTADFSKQEASIRCQPNPAFAEEEG